MKKRNRARKVWQFTRNPSDKRVLNNIQNKIHRKVKTFQAKLWEDDLRSLDPDDGSLWEKSKELRKKKSPVYALNGEAGIAHTDSDKAEILACSLETQFQDNNISNDTDYLINKLDTLRENCGIIRKQPSTDGGVLWKVVRVNVVQVRRKDISLRDPREAKSPVRV
ncbi:hypothetical protein TNCV_3447221 [Trichonephila clavipes]|nr:hypothetical protein TNCV_3447221 [Trichonephila clavipes]